jgi:hypothetical protein
MDDIVSPQPVLKTDADYKAAIEECLAEMKRLHEQMKRDQEAIEKSRARTREMLAQLKVS